MDKKVSVSTLLLVIAIMVIGVMGYMIYNMNINNENLEKQVQELANKENEEECEMKENSFALYQENYQNTFKGLITAESRIGISLADEFTGLGVQGIYIDKNNDAYLTFEESTDLYTKYGKEYKVETGVANVFLCDIGTGWYQEVVFLKLDGTVSHINEEEIELTNTVKCEKIEGVENAVNVISYVHKEGGEAGPETAIIDINGDVIKSIY